MDAKELIHYLREKSDLYDHYDVAETYKKAAAALASADAENARLREALGDVAKTCEYALEEELSGSARLSPAARLHNLAGNIRNKTLATLASPLFEPEPFKAGQKWRTSRGTFVHLVSSFEGSPVVGKCWICQTENGVQDHFPEYYMRERWTPIPAPEGKNG